MPSGGQLTIRKSRTGGNAVLEISDTGHGIDETAQARISEPLFTTKDLGRGTGLGLATVRRIVKRLGGSIGLESVPDQGTSLSIRLPAAGPSGQRPEIRNRLIVLHFFFIRRIENPKLHPWCWTRRAYIAYRLPARNVRRC